MLHQRKFRGENYIGRVLQELGSPSFCPMAGRATLKPFLTGARYADEDSRVAWTQQDPQVSLLSLTNCFPDI